MKSSAFTIIRVWKAALLLIWLPVFLISASLPALASEGHGNFRLPPFDAYYEGRASIVDSGDFAARHGIYNILWVEMLEKSKRSSEIFIRARAQNFEGDSFVKQYNAMPEANGASFTEAYFRKISGVNEFKFGLFHAEPTDSRLMDVRDFINGLDPLNPVVQKKGQGNMLLARRFKGVRAYFDYNFDVDYPNSLKILGAKKGGVELFYAFNDARKIAYADYEKAVNEKLSAHANYRRTEFSLLNPIYQASAGLVYRPEKSGWFEKGGFKREFSLDYVSNRTDNGFFLMRRNIADIMAAGVLFPYQKAFYAASVAFKSDRRWISEAFVKYYAAAAPMFGTLETGGTDIAGMAAVYPGVKAKFDDFSAEMSFLRILRNDGSGTFQGRLQTRISVSYPF